MKTRSEIIFKKINERHQNYKGKIVAIDVETGDYFIGESVLDAYRKAREKHPQRKFIFKRIGFPSTHFVGAI